MHVVQVHNEEWYTESHSLATVELHEKTATERQLEKSPRFKRL